MNKLAPGVVKVLYRFSRVLAGVVFIFSGFVKAVDPTGSAYKFSDYFIAFHIRFLEFFAMPLAILLSAAEFLIGISIIFGYRHRLAAWLILIFLSFFTVLTFILALTNPVSDCGCFGDAIIMTNWQTFFKNLILMPFVLFIFFFRKQVNPLYPGWKEWIFIAIFAVMIFSLQFHSLRHLPPLDFRPYSIGTNIPDKMIVPEGAPVDEYKTYLYYEKNGVVEEFNEDNFPWQDSTWKFVDSKHILVKKGYEPPVHDLTMVNYDGYDHTENILSDPDYSMLLISVNLTEANVEALKKADVLASFCNQDNCSFYCLTASSLVEIEQVSSSLALHYVFYTTDEITLKTMIRSNPGLILLKEGTIIAKWHFRDFPEIEELENGYLPYSLTSIRQSRERNTVFLFVTGIFLLAGVFHIFGPVSSFKL